MVAPEIRGVDVVDENEGSAAEGTPDPGTEVQDAPRTPVTQQIGRVALVVIAVLFVVFAAANAQPVDFSWVLGETEVVEQGGAHVRGGVPLIVLLVVSFAAGAAVATLLSWQRHRHRRRG